MRMVYSPWGHEVTPGDNSDALAAVRAEYKVRSFPAEFSFIARNRDLEDEFDWSLLMRKKKGYNPVRKDPFVFKSMKHYLDTLSFVRTFVDKLEDELTAAGFLDDGPRGARKPTIAAALNTHAAILVSEYDIIRRFTIQRVTYPFWYLPVKPPKESEVTAEHAMVFEALLQGWKRAVPSRAELVKIVPQDDMADPVDTNVGSPFFKSGDGVQAIALRLQYAAMFAGALAPKTGETAVRLHHASQLAFPSTLASALQRIAEIKGMPATAVAAVAANSRTGAARNKSASHYVPAGGEMRLKQTVSNFPRVRQVFMAPWWFNLSTGSASRLLKAVRKRVPGWWHDAEGTRWLDNALADPNDLVIESDISGLDQNISPKHRRHILLRVATAWQDCMPIWVRDVLLQHNYLSYVTPDPTAGSEIRFSAAEYMPTNSGTGLYSGIKLTSDINSMFVTWAVAVALYRAKLVTLDELRTPVWPMKFGYANAGDDVILKLASKADFTRVSELMKTAFAEFGVEAKLAAGRRFLMRHRVGGSNFPVLGRITQQTISNEHLPDSVALFMLGASARSDGLVGLDAVMTKADPKVRSIWQRYFKSSIEVMRETTLGKQVIPLLLEKDMRKRLATRNALAAQLVREKKQDTLLDIIQAERFSATGKELLNAVNTTLLLREIMKSDRVRIELYNRALAVTGAYI